MTNRRRALQKDSRVVLLTYGIATTLGRRSINEDAALAGVLTADADTVLLAVADGMGGAPGGDVASKLALDAAVAALRAAPSQVDVRAVADALRMANQEVHAQGQSLRYAGMGTTLTMVVLQGAGGVLGHVGDTRAYLVRGGSIRRLTEDHTWVAERVRAGRLTAAQAETHPRRNILTRVLGPQLEVAVDVAPLALGAGDWLVLCSDGVHGVLTDDEIARVCRAGEGPQTAAANLIALVERREGSDNATVVVARVG